MDDCWTEVLAGVPQGAVLSPLLYAVFINDSHEQASATVALKHSAGYLLYADDMALAPNTQLNVTERHAQLQEALTALGDWARKWGVRFSATKSGVMWFFQGGTAKHTLTTARALPPLSIQHADGPAIHLPFVEAYQYLGVWLNAKLTSHTHFRHVLEKCTPMSALLRRVQLPDAPPRPRCCTRAGKGSATASHHLRPAILHAHQADVRTARRFALSPTANSACASNVGYTAPASRCTHSCLWSSCSATRSSYCW